MSRTSVASHSGINEINMVLQASFGNSSLLVYTAFKQMCDKLVES